MKIKNHILFLTLNENNEEEIELIKYNKILKDKFNIKSNKTKIIIKVLFKFWLNLQKKLLFYLNLLIHKILNKILMFLNLELIKMIRKISNLKQD